MSKLSADWWISRSVPEQPQRRSDRISRLQLFLNLVEDARAVLDADDVSWEIKCDYIFDLPIAEALKGVGIGLFDWTDPNTSTRDTATAYVEALEEQARQMRGILVALQKTGTKTYGRQ